MAYGDFEDIPRITASDIALRDKAFNISKNLKQVNINVELIIPRLFLDYFLLREFLKCTC